MPKARLLAPIHPNAGVEAEYRRRLQKLIAEMNASVLYFVSAAYRANEPVLAQDAVPADELRKALAKLGRRWRKRFDDAAPDLATYFATDASKRSDFALRAALKKGGFTIAFKPTPTQRDVMAATVQANVSLIKSIPDQYLTQVEGSVMRAVQTGGDLGALTKELTAHYGVTKKRAAFIASDQGNKATAALKKARQTELGIEEEEWVHSGGGKHPRPTHVKAGKDRVRYKISEGWLDPATGRRIWPGTEPGCRCVGRSVIPTLG